jgi:hypothetical protein
MNYLTLVTFVILMISCHKPNGSEPVNFQDNLKRYVDKNKETFTYDNADKSIRVKTSNNTRVRFEDESFDFHGHLYTGPVRIEITEIFSKADMILAGLPTVMRPENKGIILTSGGEILIQAYTEKGYPLNLNKPFTAFVSSQHTNTSGQDMQLFELENIEVPFWVPLDSQTAPPLRQVELDFMFSGLRLQWYNIDKIEATFTNTTMVYFIHPPGLNEMSTRFFINIPALPNSIADENIPLPIDQKCQIFMIQFGEEENLYGHLEFKVSPGTIVNTSSMVLTKGDYEALGEYLDRNIK